MTNALPTVIEQTSDHITFSLSGLDADKGVYVCYDIYNYDTSTGTLNTYRGNYYVWRCKSLTGGIFRIDATNIANQSMSIDYSTLTLMYFSFFPWVQYVIFDMFSLKIDMVSRRYPETFEKKFSLHELDSCIEAAMADINLYPPTTGFWFQFSSYDDTMNIKKNPYSITTGIPFELYNLVATGSMINALVSQGILEVDINFAYSDQGINITYQNMDPIKGWWTSLLENYNKDRALCKMNYYKISGISTVDFAVGLPGLVQTSLGALSTAGFPFWKAFSLGRSM